MAAKDLLMDLVDYVEQVHRLSERVVTRLQDYRDLVLHEIDLKGREGVQHDLIERGEAIWLKIDRLRRTEPPQPPAGISDWITVSPRSQQTCRPGQRKDAHGHARGRGKTGSSGVGSGRRRYEATEGS